MEFRLTYLAQLQKTQKPVAPEESFCGRCDSVQAIVSLQEGNGLRYTSSSGNHLADCIRVIVPVDRQGNHH